MKISRFVFAVLNGALSSFIRRLAAANTIVASAFLAPFGHTAEPRTYETNVWVETVAGSGFRGLVNGIGTSTMFDGPTGLAVDSKTNVYVWDHGNGVIRKISPDYRVTTFAGSGRRAVEDGVGTNASFYVQSPAEVDLVATSDGTLYFVNLQYLRKISPAGEVTTVCGSAGLGYRDGPLAQARFGGSFGLAIDRFDNLYVADEENNRLRKVDRDGHVITLAGSGNWESVDGVGIFSSFASPHGIAVDPVGNIYVAERVGQRIRKISPDGSVRTFAGNPTNLGGDVRDGSGTNAIFRGPLRLVADTAGNLFTSEYSYVRRVSPEANVTTVAGGPEYDRVDGEGMNARFAGATGIALGASGALWVADSPNNRIRRVLFQPAPVEDLTIAAYAGVSLVGPIGQNYRVESRNALAARAPWQVAVERFTLTNSPTLWIDQDSPGRHKRFYRAIRLP